MEKRKLGKSGLEFAPIAFGGNVFGWTADEATSHKLLDAFVDAGFSFVDTADVYSRWVPGHKGGESEVIIGSWLKKNPAKREKVLIATKCGMVPAEGALTRAHIKKSVDESLQRMNTDRIDLFQSHKDDKATPLEETLSTYGELVKAGKLRAIGASNYDAPRLAEAAKISRDKGLPRYESLQPHYNLVERGLFEGALENECLKEGIGVIPYYSLASGFLSGKYRSESDVGNVQRGAGVKKYINPKGMGVLKALDDAAKKHNANPAQIALAWLMQRKSITAPIVSATSLQQLKDLIAAPAVKLDTADVAAIDKASAP
jgi:aryl-alcohol dehydrogenase-like predicted oxidoreductase